MTRLALCTLLIFAGTAPAQIPPVDFAIQGSSMRLRFNNVGAFGHIACPPFNPANPGGCEDDSIGMEYPVGSHEEHLYGSGIWVGGLLDTSSSGSSTALHLVSLSYEGWAGPYYEFYPGTSAADTIWEAAHGAPKPAGWDQYWGNDLPYRPFADDNRFCSYTDTSVRVAIHTPLRLRVIQSSYTWSDPYADGIHIVEYRLFNSGIRVIDSVFIGFFLEPDISTHPLVGGLVSGFLNPPYLAYCQNTHDSTLHPVGFGFAHLPIADDSVRWTFQCFPGVNSPPDDASKYGMVSSGIIEECGIPSLTGLRMILSAGPFTLQPHDEPLIIAVAYLSGPNVDGLALRLERARELYAVGTGVLPTPDGLPESPLLMQNYPNPFNPSTTIRYAVPGRAGTLPAPQTAGRHATSLEVFDVLGRRVATLVDGVETPGVKTVQFNAADLPSGIYFYRLSVGGFVQTRRMMLVK
jgi:hypothetical protein